MRTLKIAKEKLKNKIKTLLDNLTCSDIHINPQEIDNTHKASDLIIDSTEIYQSRNVTSNLHHWKDHVENFVTEALKQKNGPETALTYLNDICNAFNNYPNGANIHDDLDNRIKPEEQNFLSQQFVTIAKHADYETTRKKAIQCTAPLQKDNNTAEAIRELSKFNRPLYM